MSNYESVDFKNTISFATRIIKERNNSIFDSINKYKKELNISIIKDKENLLMLFNTKKIWKLMIDTDYFKFSNFCEEYSFDKKTILKNQLVVDFVLSYTSLVSNKNIDLFICDIKTYGKEFLSNINNFYPQKVEVYTTNNKENVFSCLLNILAKKDYLSAIKYINFFEKELNNYGKLLGVECSICSENGLYKFIEQQQKTNGIYSVDFRLNHLLKNREWNLCLTKYKLKYKLKNELNENLLIKKIINKI